MFMWRAVVGVSQLIFVVPRTSGSTLLGFREAILMTIHLCAEDSRVHALDFSKLLVQFDGRCFCKRTERIEGLEW